MLKKRISKFTATFLAATIMLSATGEFVAATPSVENNYIIKFKNETGKDKFKKDRAKGKKVKKDFEEQSSLVIEATSAEVASLAKSADVLYIEPDSPVEILSIGEPDKTDSKVKGMRKNTQETPKGIKDIGAEQTFKKYDGKNVNVAIFDTGISAHEDLDIKGGISLVDYTTSYADDNGHGTHVAGTVAANNNKIGVVGVAPNANVYAVKVLDKNGGGNYSTIIEGIEWAVKNDIDVINMSLGGKANSKALEEAIQQATNNGIIVVAAAGNSGFGEDTMMYPAKYSEVISVGAVDENNQVAYFSSRGPDLDVVAPGTSVLSTTNDGTYATMSGTSMAAPHVTGAIASLKSKDKKVDSEEISKIILYSTNQLGNKSEFGHGIINLEKAVGVLTGTIEPNKSIEEIVEIPMLKPDNETDKPEEQSKPPEGIQDEYEYYKKYHEKPLNTDEYGNPLPSLPDVTILEANNVPPAPEPEFNYNDTTISESSQIDTTVNKRETSDDTIISETETSDDTTISETETSDDTTISERETSDDTTISERETSDDTIISETETSDDTIISETETSDDTIISETETSDDTTISETETADYTATSESEQPVKEDDISLLSTTTGSGGSISDSIVSSTRIDVSLKFPANSYNKQMQYYDSGKGVWTKFYYNGATHIDNSVYSGTYAITGLTPYSTYVFKTWWTIGSGTTFYSVEHTVTMPLPPEVLVSSSTENLKFSMEQMDINLFNNYTTWKNRMQTVYSDMKDLTGYTPAGRDFREIKTTRTLIPRYWATAGDPILLNRTYTPQMISQINSRGDWAFGVAHELGHEFDNYKWNFDSEFWANFKMYYSIEKNNATVHVGYTDYYTGGAALKNYYKSISNANGGSMCYDNSLAKGTYSNDGLTYKFIDIKDKIGWEPFRKTFRYFNELKYENAPTTNIGKFNLFITKLKEYSNVDVLSMFTANEKNAIQNKFGGTIAYVIPQTVTPIYDNIPIDVKVDQGKFELYKFAPTVGGNYIITTSPYGGGTESSDTYLELYADEYMSTKLAYNDDYNGTAFSEIEYGLNANVTYYIKLRGYNNYSTSARLIVKINNLFTDLELENIANYHNNNYLFESITPDISRKIPMYDDENKLFAYAIPYMENGSVTRHINVGALRDGLDFYAIESRKETFLTLEEWVGSGYKIRFSSPIGYSKFTGAVSSASLDESDLPSESDSFRSEENRIYNEKFLIYDEDVTVAEDIQSNGMKLINIMLESEKNLEPINYPNYGKTWNRFITIIDTRGIGSAQNKPGPHYGGNQDWYSNTYSTALTKWLTDNAVALGVPDWIRGYTNWHIFYRYQLLRNPDTKEDEFIDGWYLDQSGFKYNSCGVVAGTDIMIYLAMYNPKFKTLASGVNTVDKSIDITQYIYAMRNTIEYIEPTIVGIYAATMLKDGIKEYAASKNVTLTDSNFKIKYFSKKTDSTITEARELIKESLNANLPVAMLIRLNSDMEGQYAADRHWMTITKYHAKYEESRGENSGAQYVAVASWGQRITLNFKSCMNTIGGIGPSFMSVGW